MAHLHKPQSGTNVFLCKKTNYSKVKALQPLIHTPPRPLEQRGSRGHNHGGILTQSSGNSLGHTIVGKFCSQVTQSQGNIIRSYNLELSRSHIMGEWTQFAKNLGWQITYFSLSPVFLQIFFHSLDLENFVTLTWNPLVNDMNVQYCTFFYESIARGPFRLY